MAFLNLSINPFFYNFFKDFFVISFHIHIRISKNLSAKYYREDKERLQKKARERYQNEKN